MPLHSQVNSACPGLPRPALISPKTLCPLLSCDPVWFHPPCMLLILCDSVSSSTHFPAQSHCAYVLGSHVPDWRSNQKILAPLLIFTLVYIPDYCPGHSRSGFSLQLLSSGFLNSSDWCTEWACLGPFNVRGLAEGLIDPPDF